MKKTKKALASLAIAGMTLSMIPFNVFAASPVNRIAGVTAEQTAVQIAEQTGYTGTAILASSTSYGMVDALTAGPLAASLKAPILLTGAGSSLDAATKAELTKLAVKKVYVTSGTAVIKQSVIDELKGMGIEVEALGGYDRAETSVNIAKKMTGVTKVAVANTVVDALSIAAVASAANEPILLTDRDALPASVAAYLASAGVTASDVIGGTGVISDAVAAKLPSAARHAGMSAYDTNNKVIQDFAGSLKFDTVYVANGVTGIDALAGAPLAAQTQSPIVLTDGKTVPQAAAFTYEKSPVGAVVTALGGEFVVPEAVRAGVAAGKVTPDSNELSIVSVSALNDANSVLQIKFTKPVVSIDRGDITIQNAKTLARYGVEEVSLLSGGTMAEVKLYETVEGQKVLQSNTEYSVTVVANGTTLKGVFNRADWREDIIRAVRSDDKEIDISNKTLEIQDPKFDYQNALGRTARVWFNQDDEVTSIIFDEQETKYDAIEITDNDEIKLLTEDKKYDAADNIQFYIDGEDTSTDLDDILDQKYDFAKIVYDDNGDIEFVAAYTWQNYLVVSEVEEDLVVGVDGTDDFDAEDAIIVKGGKEITLADIKAGDVLYFSNAARDNEGFAEVLNNTVTGEIESVYSDSIEVDGVTYDYIDASETFGDADYTDENGDVVEIDTDAAEELQAAGDVTLHLDRKGDLVYVGGDTVAVESNSFFGFIEDAGDLVGYRQAGKDRLEVEVINNDLDTKSFDFTLESLDNVTIDGEKYDIVKTPDEADEYKLVLADQVGATGVYATLELHDQNGQVLIGGDPVEVTINTFTGVLNVVQNDNGTVTGLKFYTEGAEFGDEGKATFAGQSIESDDTYAAGKRLESGTVVIKLDSDSDVEKVTTWGAMSGVEVTDGYVIYDDGNKAKVLVVTNSDAEDVDEQKILVTEVRRNSDGDLVRVKAYVNGKEEILTADELSNAAANALEKGSVAFVEINSDTKEINKVVSVDNATYTLANLTVDTVDVGSRKVVFNEIAGAFTLVSGGTVYDATDLSDITVENMTDLRSLEATERVTVVLDSTGTKFAKAFIITSTDAAYEDAVADFDDEVDAVTALALVEGDYTADSWEDLENALAFDVTGKTVAQVIAATQAIVDAVDGLE